MFLQIPMKTSFNKAKGIVHRAKRRTFYTKLYALCSMLCAVAVNAQIYSENDVEVCNSKFSFAVENPDLVGTEKPIGDVLAEVGKSFIGTEYIAHGIEKDGEEQLVINLTGLDCTTFLENALVFSRLIKKEKTSFDDYQDELTFIRYRDGEIDQYPSRLHYFSDWIYNNQQKGIIKDVTKEIGGQPISFNLNFMSTHAEAYKHLKENPEFIPIIEEQEKEISSRTYFFIPKEKISSVEDKIHNGDLIAFTTNVKGLDIGHVGIAVKGEDGRIHLLHAPQVGSKVHITEAPLSEYVMSVKKHSGIIVLRVLEQN
ncbi:MAG: DUF1460 domain-containing protein [Ignavibacteria bacterium]|nr:DUF1460 domain-containing protein [Ignavibacteria bacterium]